jgi:hypothetical protein
MKQDSNIGAGLLVQLGALAVLREFAKMKAANPQEMPSQVDVFTCAHGLYRVRAVFPMSDVTAMLTLGCIARSAEIARERQFWVS